jgi:hypothetical protein
MNKIRRFPDGTSILSPQNRSWKGEDSKWRPEIERGVYPQNNPTYHRTPGSSPRASRTPGSASARSMSYSASQGHMMPPHDVTMLSSPQYPQQHQQQQHHQSPQQYQQQQPYHPSQQSNYQQRPASASYYPAQQQQQHQQQHHEQQAEEFEQAAAASSNWSASRGPSSRVPEKATPAAYQSSPIFDKLTDPSLYTGTHRQRFDEQGSEPQQQQIQASSASSSSSHPPPPPPTEAELELQRAREEVAALQAQVQRLQLSAYHQEQYHSPRAPTATTAGGQ